MLHYELESWNANNFINGFLFKSCVGWWKGMKQFLPAKSAEHEETPVRYSSSEVNCLRSREVTAVLQTQSAGIWVSQFTIGWVMESLNWNTILQASENEMQNIIHYYNFKKKFFPFLFSNSAKNRPKREYLIISGLVQLLAEVAQSSPMTFQFWFL